MPKAFEYDEGETFGEIFYDTLAYMKLEKLIEARFVRLICFEERGMALSGHSRSHGKIFDSGYDKSHMRLFGMYAKIYERKGVVPP